MSQELPAKQRARLRRSLLTGFRLPRKLSVHCSNAVGDQIATQGSSAFARTTPSANEGRNFAGTLSRFLASSVYSNCPRKANLFSGFHVQGRKFLRAAVPEWEEPRHRGPIKVSPH